MARVIWYHGQMQTVASKLPSVLDAGFALIPQEIDRSLVSSGMHTRSRGDTVFTLYRLHIQANTRGLSPSAQ